MVDGLFDVQFRMEKIESKKHALVILDEVIDWEMFRADLETLRAKPRKSNAGAKGYDLVLLFKMLVLKTMYNLSYDEIECQVLDRLSFMRFLGLTLGRKVPDATTLWHFHEALVETGLERTLFDTFDAYLDQQGLRARGGQIVDATIVEAPRQRNSREENRRIKDGEPVEGWSPAKRRQKDVDARWTKKRGQTYYGYKNHVRGDVEYKFIRDYEGTPASVHDVTPFEGLLDVDGPDRRVYGDSAYRSQHTLKRLAELGLEERLQEQARRGHPLTDRQKARNTERSRVRCRVEHIFAAGLSWTRDRIVRTIGMARARCTIGLRNLVYNLDRYRIVSTMTL
jgi:IS5 family transposase